MNIQSKQPSAEPSVWYLRYPIRYALCITVVILTGSLILSAVIEYSLAQIVDVAVGILTIFGGAYAFMQYNHHKERLRKYDKIIKPTVENYIKDGRRIFAGRGYDDIISNVKNDYQKIILDKINHCSIMCFLLTLRDIGDDELNKLIKQLEQQKGESNEQNSA